MKRQEKKDEYEKSVGSGRGTINEEAGERAAYIKEQEAKAEHARITAFNKLREAKLAKEEES